MDPASLPFLASRSHRPDGPPDSRPDGPFDDLSQFADLAELDGCWVAIDTTQGEGLASGAVLVDHDAELDALCLRVAEAGHSSLTIFRCARAQA